LGQPTLGPDAVAVIHEDIAIVMTYAFSKEPAADRGRTPPTPEAQF
jgi:hypothetical protein